MFDVVKSAYGTFTPVQTGNTISITYDDCMQSDGDVRNGSDRMRVRVQAAVDSEGASQYELSADITTRQSDGETTLARSRLKMVDSDIPMENGDVHFRGINNTSLQAEQTLSFSDFYFAAFGLLGTQ